MYYNIITSLLFFSEQMDRFVAVPLLERDKAVENANTNLVT